jgi:hypothetical protein
VGPQRQNLKERHPVKMRKQVLVLNQKTVVNCLTVHRSSQRNLIKKRRENKVKMKRKGRGRGKKKKVRKRTRHKRTRKRHQKTHLLGVAVPEDLLQSHPM